MDRRHEPVESNLRPRVAGPAGGRLRQACRGHGSASGTGQGCRRGGAGWTPAAGHRLVPGRRRRSVRRGQGGQQAGVPVLGRRVVPALRTDQVDDLQPARVPGALTPVRARLPRRRHTQRAEARRALRRGRLPDDDPVQAGRYRDHAAAGRCRHRALREDPRRRAGRCTSRERDPRGGGPRRSGHRQRLEAARVLPVGRRQRSPAAEGSATGDLRRAGAPLPAELPASAHGSCSITSARWPTHRSRASRRWTAWRVPTIAASCSHCCRCHRCRRPTSRTCCTDPRT